MLPVVMRCEAQHPAPGWMDVIHESSSRSSGVLMRPGSGRMQSLLASEVAYPEMPMQPISEYHLVDSEVIRLVCVFYSEVRFSVCQEKLCLEISSPVSS